MFSSLAAAMLLTLSAGSLTAKDVSKVVTASRPAFGVCASKHIKQATSKMEVTLTLAIEPSGKVSEVNVEQRTTSQTRLGVCLVSVAKKMEFPSFTGEALQVEVPLALSAE